MRFSLAAAVVLGVGSVATVAGCGHATPERTAALVVDVPGAADPWTTEFLSHGAQLAVAQHGDVTVDGMATRIVVEVLSDNDSPERAVANARQAVAEHAVAFVSSGAFANQVAAVTDPAGLPDFVTADGGAEVPTTPGSTLFRIAPRDDTMARRLADYLAGAHPVVAVLTDATPYGTRGAAALIPTLAADKLTTSTATVSTGSAAGAVQTARAAGATTLIVWARAPVIAAVVAAARGLGWSVPVLTGPTGEDPALRTTLAAHPGDLDGLRFVSFRPTAEVGAAPFADYRAAYQKMFGPDIVNGVTVDGHTVASPPDWAMLTFDAVRLTLIALDHTHASGRPLLAELTSGFTIVGANGDQRGFSTTQRESVSQGDIYFAVFGDETYAPVTDDALQEEIPTLPQQG